MSLAAYASETNEHPENNKYKKNKQKKFVCFNSQKWFDSLTTCHESNLRKVVSNVQAQRLTVFFFFVFCFFLTSLFIETLLFVRSRLRNWRDVMRHVNGLINSRGVHLILGVPAEVFNRQEALKQREAFCLITSTSSTCFRRKDQESFKVAEYPLLIRLEIHISLSNPNICQNLHSGLMRCHRQSILTLNLTLNKVKYTKPR